MPPGRAVPVDGGYRVTGRWRYGTGVMHADWAMGLGVDSTNPSNARWFLFPVADATVYDVWHMDGMAATALLKQDPVTAAIPVIALTAMAMKEDREKTKLAGCDAYIAKPLRYQELYAAIDGLLLKEQPQAP